MKSLLRTESKIPHPLVLESMSGNSEELLKHTQANLNAIIENSTATIYSLDRNFRYMTFNSLLKEKIQRIYGVEIKIGEVVFDFLNKEAPKEAEEWRSIYTRALAGEAMQFVKEFVIGEHNTFVRFYINPIKVGSFVTGLSCLAIDITKERLAELTIARSESKFRALIENNLDAIMVRDENWNLTYASPSMLKMIGYDCVEIESQKAPDIFVHQDDIPRLRKLYEDVTRFPGVPFPTTLRVKHKMGHYIWIEGVMTNMLKVDNVHGFVCNLRDVTKRMELDVHSEMISRDLVKRNDNLEQYAYIVSHNLRAPIANLLGLANLLELPTVSQQDREKALTHIILSAKKLDDVIKDLSSILQTNTELNQHRESIRFQEIVDNVCSSIQSIISSNGVCIRTDFSQCAGVVSIKSYVYSIFYNLISNSIKYRDPKTRAIIKISSRLDRGHICLMFEDNGLGMDLASYGDKVFGLYRRFHQYQAEGKGMGLFMVKTQVENLGGKISVKSEVRKGTVFTIEL